MAKIQLTYKGEDFKYLVIGPNEVIAIPLESIPKGLSVMEWIDIVKKLGIIIQEKKHD